MAKNENMHDDQSSQGIGKRGKTFDNLAGLNREATITGGLRSTVNNSMRGARVVGEAATGIISASREAMFAGRIEEFDAAMSRLGVASEDLPLIHNQIVLQAYLSLSTGLIAALLGAKYALVDYQLSSSALCYVVFMICMVYFIQASNRAFQIRRQKLGILSEWFVSPAEWLPSRLPNMRSMSRHDPLKRDEVVRPLAIKARRRFFVAGANLGIAFGLNLAGAELTSSWMVLFAAVGLVVLISGARYSFEVFRRRQGLHCDLGLWLLTPAQWIPAIQDPAQAGRADKLKRSKVADDIAHRTGEES